MSWKARVGHFRYTAATNFQQIVAALFWSHPNQSKSKDERPDVEKETSIGSTPENEVEMESPLAWKVRLDELPPSPVKDEAKTNEDELPTPLADTDPNIELDALDVVMPTSERSNACAELGLKMNESVVGVSPREKLKIDKFIPLEVLMCLSCSGYIRQKHPARTGTNLAGVFPRMKDHDVQILGL